MGQELDGSNDVIPETRERYFTAYERSSGRSFAEWMARFIDGS